MPPSSSDWAPRPRRRGPSPGPAGRNITIRDDATSQAGNRRRSGMSRATASGVTPTEAGIGSREWRVIIAILTGAAVLIAADWMIWFVVDRSIPPSDTRDAYYELEN